MTSDRPRYASASEPEDDDGLKAALTAARRVATRRWAESLEAATARGARRGELAPRRSVAPSHALEEDDEAGEDDWDEQPTRSALPSRADHDDDEPDPKPRRSASVAAEDWQPLALVEHLRGDPELSMPSAARRASLRRGLSPDEVEPAVAPGSEGRARRGARDAAEQTEESPDSTRWTLVHRANDPEPRFEPEPVPVFDTPVPPPGSVVRPASGSLVLPEPEPQPTPERTPEPESVPPEPEPEPASQPTPERKLDPGHDPEPEPGPGPESSPGAAPVLESVPVPLLGPEPELAPGSESSPEPGPVLESVPVPLLGPDPESGPGSESSPEPGRAQVTPEAPAPRPEPLSARASRGLEQHDTWWQRLLRPAPRYSRLFGDIEGLRAIAVTWVLLFHLGVPGFGGGFSGVDVFFVISGFLITGQLLGQVRKHGRPQFVEFYAGRARRLVPAATVVLLFTAMVGWWVVPRSEWSRMGHDLVASAFYVVNWTLAGRELNYLAEDAMPSVTQHYWSLAVEEQFYLLWPLLILGSVVVARKLRLSSRLVIGVTLVAVVGASLAWSISYTGSHPQEAYFVTTTRIWELGVGALVACALPLLGRLRRVAPVMAGAGVTGVLVSAFLMGGRAWPGSWALVPVLATTLVLVAGQANPDNRIARALGVGPMRWIGGLSYSIYLWHWPLIIFARYLIPPDPGDPFRTTLPNTVQGWSIRAAIVVASVVLAWVTGKLIETPIRFTDVAWWRTWRALRNAVVAMVVPALIGAVLLTRAPGGQQIGLPTVVPTGPAVPSESVPASTSPPSLGPVRGNHIGALALVADAGAPVVPELRQDLSAALAITQSLVPTPSNAPLDLPPGYATGCQVPRTVTAVAGRNECISGDASGTTRVALVGDSKIDQWQPALDIIGQRHGWRVQNLSKAACTFGSTRDEDCGAYNTNLLRELTANPPDVVISSSEMYFDTAATEMTRALRQLQAKGTRVVLLADVPTPTGGASVYQCAERAQKVQDCEFPRNDGAGTADLTVVARAVPGATLVSMNRWICPPGPARCPVAIGNVFTYRQSSHLTNSFVLTTTPLLERELVAARVLARVTLPLQA